MEIQDYPGYLIYDDGRIWSKPRKNTRGHQRKGRFLKHSKTKNGYHLVALCRDGGQKTFYVSRLLAQYYIPNPENKPEVDHIDRDIDNNHVSNLRWVTCEENCDNRGMYRTNTSGHEHISYHKINKRWVFRYQKKGHKVHKCFKTFHEAIAFKDEYISS